MFILALTFVASPFGPDVRAQQHAEGSGRVGERERRDDDERKQRDGQSIFRFDTFDDEQRWTNVLRMHEAIPSVNPVTALAVGLKVDVDALPAAVIDGLTRSVEMSLRTLPPVARMHGEE